MLGLFTCWTVVTVSGLKKKINLKKAEKSRKNCGLSSPFAVKYEKKNSYIPYSIQPLVGMGDITENTDLILIWITCDRWSPYPL